MCPLIEEGDKIVITQYSDESEIKRGDIVVCLKRRGLGAHRILFFQRKKNIYYTKGDNRLLFDDAVDFESIIGRVKIVIKENNVISLQSDYSKRVVKRMIILSLVIGSISSIPVIKNGILRNSNSAFIRLYKKLCFEWVPSVFTKKCNKR
jgi:signal peptidase I